MTTTVPTASVAPTRTHSGHIARNVGLVAVLSRKNFRVRYKRAALGAAWAVLQPSLQAAVVSVVFLKVINLRGIPNYPVFVLSGMLPWAFLGQSISGATSSIVDNASLVRKVAVPLTVFPLAAIGGAGIAFAASLGVLTVVSTVGGTLTPQFVLLPLAIVLQVALAAGIGMGACAFHVAFRDVRYIVESTMLVWFYGTPIVYDLSKADGLLRTLIRLNPMTGVMSLYRGAVLGLAVDWTAVGLAAATIAVLLAVGATLFRARSWEFADLA